MPCYHDEKGGGTKGGENRKVKSRIHKKEENENEER